MKHLTSRLTFFYKYIAPGTAILFFSIEVLKIGFDIGLIIPFLGLVLATAIVTRIQQITFDEKTVKISNGFKSTTYDIASVKSINDARPFNFDLFFELEIADKNGKPRYVEFLPRLFDYLQFLNSKEKTGRLKELEKIIKAGTAANKVHVP